MAKKTKTDETQPETNALTTYDWSQTGVTGLENVSREDLGVPFLVLLQKGSPEVDPTHKDYATKKIHGAAVGDIVNSLSREIVHKFGGEPLIVIPCSYEKLFMEWKPREQGGGMVKAHKDPNIITECQRNEKNQDVLRNGNLVVTTAYFYVLVVTEQGRVPAIIGLSSTQLKKARSWLNQITSIKVETPRGRITPPMFSHTYRISSCSELNVKGSWMGWKIELNGPLNDPMAIADSIETAKRAASGQRAALPPPPEDTGDANIPFA